MGTTYSIIAVNNSRNYIDNYYLKNKIDSLLLEVNNLFSTYIDSSELSKINNSKDSIIISDNFIELYLKALNIYNISNGSFDFTILNLIEKWGFGSNFKLSNIPSDSTINDLLLLSSIDGIKIYNNYLIKDSQDIKIDFSAIAKGWAVDQIAILLENMYIFDFMVEVGGEISVSGHSPSGSLWSIGITDPRLDNDQIFINLSLTDISIATSGTYNNTFIKNGVSYSHIIDPNTGYPIKHELVSATVLADDCAIADAIATAVMVKGFKRGLDWINSLPDVECLLIKKDLAGEYIYGQSLGFKF